MPGPQRAGGGQPTVVLDCRVSPISPRAPAFATRWSTAASIANGSSSRPTAPAWRSIDYDNDGWLDALTLSGTRLREGTREEVQYAPGSAPTNRLYRNMRNGTFTDVTDAAGLRRTGWASSVCAGDYDNDGWTDLFLTYYGRNVLYRNRGDGRFEDVTARAGLDGAGRPLGLGLHFRRLRSRRPADLFVANYLRFDLAAATEPGKGPNCRWKGIAVNCGPRGLPTDTNLLYRNQRRRHVRRRLAELGDREGDRPLSDDRRRDRSERAMAGPTSTSPRTPPPQSCTATIETARSPTSRWKAAPPTTRTATRRRAWAWLLATTTVTACSICSRRTSPTTFPSLYRNLGKGLFEDVAAAAGLAVENRYVEWGSRPAGPR